MADMVQVVNAARDVSARFTSIRTNVSPEIQKLEKLVARWRFEIDEDAHWRAQVEMHQTAGTQMNDIDAQDYQKYLQGRKGENYLHDRLKEITQSLGFSFRGLIALSNQVSQMTKNVSELALPIVTEQEKSNVFRPTQLGLSPDVTRAAPHTAQDMQEKAEARESLQAAYVPRNVVGPSL